MEPCQNSQIDLSLSWLTSWEDDCRFPVSVLASKPWDSSGNKTIQTELEMACRPLRRERTQRGLEELESAARVYAIDCILHPVHSCRKQRSLCLRLTKETTQIWYRRDWDSHIAFGSHQTVMSIICGLTQQNLLATRTWVVLNSPISKPQVLISLPSLFWLSSSITFTADGFNSIVGFLARAEVSKNWN